MSDKDQRNKAYKELKALISENESGLFSVLQKFRIKRKLSPKTLVLAYSRYGDEFVAAIEKVVQKESFVGGKIKDLLNLGLKAITTIGSVKNANSKPSEVEKQGKPEEKTILGMPQKIFYISLAMTSLLGIFLFTKYFKK